MSFSAPAARLCGLSDSANQTVRPMGINRLIMSWFGELADQRVFESCASVLELGPQDTFFPEEVMIEAAAKRLGQEIGEETARRAFNPALAFRERRSAFYEVFGLRQYRSVDTYDERADYHMDLNHANGPPEPFDVVVDCGTTEHVFNAGNVFVFTHNALNLGGVSLRVLPTYGDNTHGFYNIHPTVYFDIARENGYEILDFRYIENMIHRPASRGVKSLMPTDEIAAGLTSFAGCAALQAKITRSFLNTIHQSEWEDRTHQAHSAVDYCFVAMRKLSDKPFKYPGQGVYLTEFP